MVTITVVVAWLIVGDVGDAVNIGIVTNLLKTGTYYLYERTWDHITWGVSESGSGTR
ncbi:putative membrane protein [Halorubrum alkaliphilum]|uniref:Putative membrane protein n=2 Tax=Halorubrum alkaliphilum TaxID=261290 RepID=A0A8T4GG39_9EURY|nr:putative membrane protein [Halorubrum alkaliphilum]